MNNLDLEHPVAPKPALVHLQARIAVAHILTWYKSLTTDRNLVRAFEMNQPYCGTKSPPLRLGRSLAGLSTIAAMIATINAFVGGVGVALILKASSIGIHSTWMLGAIEFCAQIFGFFRYQTWRLSQAMRESEASSDIQYFLNC